jgi:autotransporter-associated beta strand protein
MLLAVAASVCAIKSTHAQTTTISWTGGTDNSWGTAADWSAAPVSGNAFLFGPAGSSGASLIDNLTTGSGYSIAGITFGSNAAAYTINPLSSSNSFTLTGAITDSSTTNTQTINDSFALSGANTFSSAGTLVLGGTISGTGSITTAGAGTIIFSGAQTGSGTVSVANGSTLVLSGNNTSTGTVVLAGGSTLQLRANSSNTTGGISNAIGSNSASGSSGLVFSNGGINNIQLRGDSSVAFSNTATANNTGSGTINFDVNNLGDSTTGQTLTFDPLSDSGRNGGQGLTTYSDTINVTGGNGYTLGLGLITSLSGLTINANSANVNIGSIAEAASDSGAIIFSGTGATNTITVGGPLFQGTGAALSVGKSGAGTLVLQGTSNFTHSVTVSGGTMNLQGGQILGDVDMNVNGGTLVVNGTGAVNASNTTGAGSFIIGNATTGAVILNSGTINAVGGTPGAIVGEGAGGNGYLILNGGSFNTAGDQTFIGYALATTNTTFGALVVNGGSFNTTSHIQLGIGSAGLNNAELVLSGGTITEGAAQTIGNNTYNASNPVPDVLTVSGGTFNSAGTDFAVGAAANAVLNLVTSANPGLVNAGSIVVGGTNATKAVVNLDGSTLSTGSISSGGATSTNLVNFNGGTLQAAGSTTILPVLTGAGGSGLYVYSGGGTINSNGKSITIAQPFGTTTGGSGVSLSGVSITSSSGYLAPPIVTVSGTGTGATAIANINSSGQVTGFTVTNPGIGYTGTPTFTLTGGGGTTVTSGSASTATNSDGPLYFLGGGTTTLTGTSAYTGAINVTGGTLAIGGSGAVNSASGITINGTGAVLSLNSSTAETPGITVTKGELLGGGTFSGGAGTIGNGTGGSVGNSSGDTFTLSSLNFLGTGTASLSILGGGTTNASPALNVTGNLKTIASGGGEVTLNVTGVSSLVAGDTYDLIQYGSLTGGTTDFSIGSVPGFGARSLTLGISGGNILTLTVSASPDSPKWTGLDNNNWVVGATGSHDNWKLINAGTPTNYISGDVVLFDDTGSAAVNPGSVSISAANVTPSSTQFNNDGALSYTVYSSGGYGINGAGSLAVTGGGKVTLLTSNGYTGSTSITSGTLQLGNGTSSNDGSLGATSGMTNNGALVVDRYGTGTDGYAISGTGSVIVNGPGTETLSASNSFTGGVTLSSGTLNVGTTSALGATTGTLIVNSGVLNLAGNSPTVGVLNGSGGTIVNNGSGAATLTFGSSSNASSYAGSFANNNNSGTGVLSINMASGSTVTLSGSSSYTGGTFFGGTNGTLILANSNAVGASTVSFNNTSGNTLDIATNGGDYGFSIGDGSGASFTILSDRATAGAGIGHSLGGGTLGTGTVILSAGSNVTSGIASLSFAGINLSSGFNGTTFFNPTNVNVSFGSVNSISAFTHTLDLDGSTAGNLITGPVTNSSGTIALTKSGSSTWTLAGQSNTYTGATNISGGTLQLGTGIVSHDGLLTATSSVLDNGNLVYDPAGTVAATYVIAGSGNVSMIGSGTVTLTATNGYAGATNVLGGTMIVSGAGVINNTSGITINGSGAKFVYTSSNALTPNVTVTQGTFNGTGTVAAVTVGAGSGGIVANGNGGSGVLTLSSLTYSGTGVASFNLAGGASTSPVMVVGTLQTPGTASSITVNANFASSVTTGTDYDLLSETTYASGSNADFVLGTVTGIGPRDTATLVTDPGNGDLALTFSGDSPKWSGLDNNNWVVGSTGPNGNWKLVTAGTATDYRVGDTVLFDDTGSSAVNPGSVSISAATVTPASTTFSNDGALSYTIYSTGGYGIGGTGGVTLNGGGLVTLLTSNSYTGSTTITSGTLQLGNGISGSDGIISSTSSITDNGALVYDRTGTYTDNLAISGTGSVIYNGVGTETVSASNTYTGGTTISGGTVLLNGAGAIPSTGTFAITGGNTLLGNASAIPSAQTVRLSGGTLNLNGKNLTIAALSDGGSSGGTLTNSASAVTLTVAGTGSTTYSGAITGAVSLFVSGAGTLELSGANNSYTGANSLGVSAGAATVIAAATGALGTGTINFDSIGNGSHAILQLTGGITLSNNINLYARTTPVNPAIENLSGTNTLSGAFSNSVGGGYYDFQSDSGTLILSSSTPFSLSNGKGLLLAGAGNGKILSPITQASGAGSVAMNGSGTWILGAGASTFSAGTYVNSGTLQLGTNTAGQDSDLVATSGISVASGANLAYAPAGTATGTYIISGGGNVAMTGSGTTVLSTAETYSGATNVNNGILDVTGSLANSGSINVTVSNTGATLILDGANALNSSAPITGTTTGTALPLITVKSSQNLGAITNAGTTNFTSGTSTVASFAGTGTLVVASPVTLTVSNSLNHGGIISAGTINVNGGATNLVGTINDASVGQTSVLNVNTGANLTVAPLGHIIQGVVNIASGSTVTVSSNPNGAFNPTSTIPSPTISAINDLYNNGGSTSLTSGTLDLKNNALIVNDPNEASSIINAVYNAADFNPGSGSNQWDKPGITSSSAQANASSYALGSLTGPELTNLGSTTFQGLPVTSNSTVVAYTLIGDTQLRGTVDGTDYNNVLANYDTAGDWSQGNFYNESIVSGDDYNAVLNAYDVAAAGGAKGRKPAITRSLSPATVGSPVATSGTFHLEVNTTSGDVVIFNDSTSSAPLTLYNIVDGSQQDLLIGNPADGNGTSSSINSGSAPYTNEHFLSVPTNDSNGVASITGRSSTNYKAWSLVLDGYNSNATALALSEGGQANKTDTINVPSYYSIDLGDIFNVGTTTVALTFQWGTETSAGGEGGTVYSNQPIDYVGAPEPASLGLLGLGGLAMMRRRRKA